jgi:hypothetical protein
VVIGDNAYEVRDGFLGELLPEHPLGAAGKQPPAGQDHGRWALEELTSLSRTSGLG